MITWNSKGQIATPKSVREAMNLAEGTKLSLQIRGQQIVLSKEPLWKRLEGSLAGDESMNEFATFRKHQRDREDSRF